MHQSTSQSMMTMFSIALLSTQSLAQDITAAPEPTAPIAGGDWATAVTWPAGCESWLNPCPAGALTSGAAPTPEAVTWPAGCETWANPCPASAIVSAAAPGWSSAASEPYENPFTSYTTMTNSEGVITGMPAVATYASGVSDVNSWQSEAMAGWGSSTMSTIVVPTSAESAAESSSMPSGTADYSFVAAATSATTAPYEGAASSNSIATGTVAVTFVGLLVSLFA